MPPAVFRAVLPAVGLLALTAVPAGQQAPVFRSRVDLVTVDVTVLDAAGRPIETLSSGDFRLKVDGSARRVLSAEYVPYRTAASSAPPEVPVTSNEHVATGRVILLAVDQGNIRRTEGRVALRAAAAFLDTLDAADRVAAVALDVVGAISFTDDHRSVKRALTRLTGRGVGMTTEFKLGIAEALAVADGNRSRLDQVVLRECGQPLGRLQNMERLATGDGMRDPCPTHIEQQARMVAHSARSQGAESLDALQRLLRRLGDMDGPKALVLLSEGLIAEPQRVDMTELAALAQKARVSMYVLQLDSPVADAASDALSPTLADDFRVRADGLARLAGAGGGALFHLVGTDPRPFTRILRELSGYYLLAFEATRADRDDRTHRIDVSVARAGVTVRARPAFRVPPAPVAPVSTEDRLVQLLRAPRLTTELPLRLSVVNRLAADSASIQSEIALEAGALDSDITYAAVVVDARGLVVTSATGRSTTGRQVFRAVLPVGRYLLKAAAVEATGRAGTVAHALEATVHGEVGGRQWSDLLLLIPAEAPDVPARPIVDRTESNRIAASVEVYGDAPEPGSVRFELAGTGGNQGRRLTVDAQATINTAGTRTIGAEFDLGELPDGRYVLTATLPSGQTLTRSFFLVQ